MIDTINLTHYRNELDSMLAAAGEHDPATFAAIVALLDDARRMLPYAAAELRKPRQHDDEQTEPYTWGQIGEALGVSRSAAQQRFGTG